MRPSATAIELRRFDLEHTFRFWKQTPGWTAPKSALRRTFDLGLGPSPRPGVPSFVVTHRTRDDLVGDEGGRFAFDGLEAAARRADPGLRITCLGLGLSYVLAIGKNPHRDRPRRDQAASPAGWPGTGAGPHAWIPCATS